MHSHTDWPEVCLVLGGVSGVDGVGAGAEALNIRFSSNPEPRINRGVSSKGHTRGFRYLFIGR